LNGGCLQNGNKLAMEFLISEEVVKYILILYFLSYRNRFGINTVFLFRKACYQQRV